MPETMPTRDVPARNHRLAHIDAASLVRADADDAPATTDRADDRTMDISFSSEEPYERWWGVEILGHGNGEVDTSFIGTGRAPLLLDHRRTIDAQVGVVESVTISEGRGTARIRFGKSAKADEILARVRDGELTNISVGYDIRALRLDSETDGVATYRVTDWKPNEISLVTVPADETVGVGRSGDAPTVPVPVRLSIPSMPSPISSERSAAMPAENETKTETRAEDLVLAERKRAGDIRAIGSKFNMADRADKAINDGVTVEAFRATVMDALGEGAGEKMAAANAVGLTEKEAQKFSFLRAIRAMANPNDAKAQRDARFEIEVSQAGAEKMRADGRTARGLVVPSDVLRAPMTGQMQASRAALAYSSAASAGNLVATTLDSANMIDVLRNRIMLQNLGARVLSDLVGDLDIPRKVTASNVGWGAEGGNAPEGGIATDLVQFRLKTVHAYIDVTRKMMAQSSVDMETLIRDDLMAGVALAIDRAGFHGTGSSNQPLGLAGLSGIGAVAGGTNGAAPTFAHVVNLETEVAVDNADIGNLAYVTNARIRGRLKQTEKAANTAQFVWADNEVNGYQAFATNQVRGDLTKGSSSVCSAIFFGNWSDVVLAFWSGLDLMVDNTTLGLSGGKRIIAHQDCDIQFRRPQSFAAMLDALAA